METATKHGNVAIGDCQLSTPAACHQVDLPMRCNEFKFVNDPT